MPPFFIEILLLLYCYSSQNSQKFDNWKYEHFYIEKDPKSFDFRSFPYFFMVEISGIEPLTS